MLANLVECIHARLWVQWVNGKENLTVFLYDKGTKAFTPTPLAAGRAAITVDGDTIEMSLQGETAASVTEDGVLTVKQFREGAPRASSPRLEFVRQYRSIRRLATLSKDGVLSAPQIIETDELPAGSDQFHFLSNVSIGIAGVLAAELVEAEEI